MLEAFVSLVSNKAPLPCINLLTPRMFVLMGVSQIWVVPGQLLQLSALSSVFPNTRPVSAYFRRAHAPSSQTRAPLYSNCAPSSCSPLFWLEWTDLDLKAQTSQYQEGSETLNPNPGNWEIYFCEEKKNCSDLVKLLLGLQYIFFIKSEIREEIIGFMIAGEVGSYTQKKMFHHLLFVATRILWLQCQQHWDHSERWGRKMQGTEPPLSRLNP